MDNEYIKQIKNDYIRLLTLNSDTKRAKEILELNTYEPIFKVREAHPQAEPEPRDFNESMEEIYRDLSGLTVGFRTAGINYYGLMKDTKLKLEQIINTLNEEKERLEDISILCNQYTDFDTVYTLSDIDISGDFSLDNNILSAKKINESNVSYEIIQIDGNGYEGNKYVYKNNAFLKDTIDTSNKNFITDKNLLTVYEYSRLTANNKEKYICESINFDNIEAKCILTLYSGIPINMIKINVSSDDTIMNDIQISDDGIKYASVLDEPITIKSSKNKFEKAKTDYLVNSGIFCFPSTNYLKIVLQSNGITDDKIAFENVKVSINETEGDKKIENNNKNNNSEKEIVYDKATEKIEEVVIVPQQNNSNDNTNNYNQINYKKEISYTPVSTNKWKPNIPEEKGTSQKLSNGISVSGGKYNGYDIYKR